MGWRYMNATSPARSLRKEKTGSEKGREVREFRYRVLALSFSNVYVDKCFDRNHLLAQSVRNASPWERYETSISQAEEK